MSFIDDFSPDYVGSDAIKVSLAPTTISPAVGQAVIFQVDYSGADGIGGIVLPLVVTVQAPTTAGFYRRMVTRAAPAQFVYFPISGGKHLLTIAEAGHNQVFGALPFDVAGDQLSIPAIGRG